MDVAGGRSLSMDMDIAGGLYAWRLEPAQVCGLRHENIRANAGRTIRCGRFRAEECVKS